MGAITRGLAEDHDTWNRAFIAGWEKIAENGYKAGELVPGPSMSWLGGGHLEGESNHPSNRSVAHIIFCNAGSLAEAQYPLVFTDNTKLKPSRGPFQTNNFRDQCLRCRQNTKITKPSCSCTLCCV